MSITAEYQWSETTASVRVAIPLKGTSPGKMGVVTAPLLVKVNFSPFLLEIDLAHAVDDLRAAARVRDGVLHLTLPKSEAGLWGRLDVAVPADVEAEGKRAAKKWLRARRQRSLDEQAARNATLEEEAKAQRIVDSRNSVREQMATESRVMTNVDTIKSEQKQAAEDEVFRVFGELEKQGIEEASAAAPPRPQPPRPAAAASKTAARPAAKGAAKAAAAAAASAAAAAAEEEEEEIRYIPAPRPRQRIALSFTHRAFPTPKRESKREEEEEYLAKNAAYLRKRNPDARNIAEYHPMWLKGKGDDFYRRGDFQSAISAYSSALDADPTCLAALSNRAACRLQVRDFARALADCTAALTAIPTDGSSSSNAGDAASSALAALGGAPTKGPVAKRKERKLRLRLLSRAGAACCGLGNFREGLRHLQQALAIDSENVPLQLDVQRAARLQQCAALKLEGDRLYRGTDKKKDAATSAATAKAMAAGRATLAIEKYSEALALESGFVSALSNRAACNLALGGAVQLDACVTDCERALALLDADEAQSIGGVPLGLPPPKSDERLLWRVKTLLRRGGAYARRRQLILAADDFDAALRLLPVDVLAADLIAAAGSVAGRANAAKALADAPASKEKETEEPTVRLFAGMRAQITRDLERIHSAMVKAKGTTVVGAGGAAVVASTSDVR